MSGGGERATPALLLAAAVAAAYATAFAGAFQFDDWRVVVGDPRVQSIGAWWASMPGIRPLLKLSYAANHASGLGLAGFHAVNLAVHVAGTLLAFALLRRMGERVDPGAAEGATRAAALAGALVFALHPVQTEAVTYVSGRSTSLAGALALASALAWIEGRERRCPPLWAALSPLLLAASLGVKETALVLPAALLLLAAADRRAPFSLRSALRATAPHWLVLGAVAAAFAAAAPYRRMLLESLASRPHAENLWTQLRATAWLAGQLVRPDLVNADPALPSAPGPGPLEVGTALVLAGTAALAIARLRRHPWAWAALWFVLWLAPAGWIVPRLDPANDRQLHLALLGPGFVLGGALAAGWRARALPRAAAAALVLALAWATSARNLVYRDEITFWEDVARKAPHNARAWNNLGWALAACGRADGAVAAFEQAAALDPRDPQPRVNLALLRRGELAPDAVAAGCPRAR